MARQKDIGEHLRSHCHLTLDGEIFNQAALNHCIDRKKYYRHGLPNGDILMTNGKLNNPIMKSNGDVISVTIKVKIQLDTSNRARKL